MNTTTYTNGRQEVTWHGSAAEAFTVAEQNLSRRNVRAVETRKVGRNDPCPCGSGKKAKKCCAAAVLNR